MREGVVLAFPRAPGGADRKYALTLEIRANAIDYAVAGADEGDCERIAAALEAVAAKIRARRLIAASGQGADH